jgi:choline dehydrogenase-like flavoprotein
VGYRYTIGNPAWDWCQTSQEPTLSGRTIKHPRGKAVGGSTVINGMEVVRGQAADYNAWRDLGLPGWGWDEVLPCFKRHEDYAGGADEHHGRW